MPTFMAKPHNNLPGCSGHIHVSLQDSSGGNIFSLPDGQIRSDAKWEDLKYVSENLEWFLAGILKGLPDVMPLLVPTVNGCVTYFMPFFVRGLAVGTQIQTPSRKVHLPSNLNLRYVVADCFLKAIGHQSMVCGICLVSTFAKTRT